ncbi:MAG: 1-acyl-sn-glycerol-3-phosphate acyltransferase [Flavobacteriaceae bacterium]|nr:1-acyl-sn-glycerol-3-phosphate acyltransferase [Flavobacteriaceae bacterium]
MFPFLLVTSSSDKLYPYFFKLARIWAKIILFGMGFRVKLKKESEIVFGKSYMFVANHTSMTDIMLMLAIEKNPFVFVGKKELAKIPLFGFFYKRTCILVDRNSSQSKKEVFNSAQQRLNSGISICIFPEGGVFDECDLVCEFKTGAFRLALEHQIPIIPMTFVDNFKRLPYDFLTGGSPGKMRVTIHKPILTKGLDISLKNKLKKQTRTLIYDELKRYNS